MMVVFQQLSCFVPVPPHNLRFRSSIPLQIINYSKIRTSALLLFNQTVKIYGSNLGNRFQSVNQKQGGKRLVIRRKFQRFPVSNCSADNASQNDENQDDIETQGRDNQSIVKIKKLKKLKLKRTQVHYIDDAENNISNDHANNGCVLVQTFDGKTVWTNPLWDNQSDSNQQSSIEQKQAHGENIRRNDQIDKVDGSKNDSKQISDQNQEEFMEELLKGMQSVMMEEQLTSTPEAKFQYHVENFQIGTHTSRKGNDCLKILWKLKGHDDIFEYYTIIPKCQDWWMKHGGQSPPPENMHEAIKRKREIIWFLNLVKAVELENNSGFWNVVAKLDGSNREIYRRSVN